MLQRNLKGDLSINMIVVAGIALIVLLVIVMIFSGRIGAFRGGIEACSSNGGKCEPITDATCSPAQKLYGGCGAVCGDSIFIRGSDCEPDRVCCKEI